MADSVHEVYRSRQFARWLLVPLVMSFLAPLALGAFMTVGPGPWFSIIMYASAAVVLVVGWITHRMDVVVDSGNVRWSMGGGVVRRSIPISSITGVEATAKDRHAGWGIQSRPRGWCWRVAGLGMVTIDHTSGGLKSHRSTMLGAPDPFALAAAIEFAVDSLHAGGSIGEPSDAEDVAS